MFAKLGSLAQVVAFASLLCLASAAASPAQVGGCAPSWMPTFGGAPGANDTINAAVVFDDGSGPALFVAGAFTTVGGIDASRVAKWDGTSWSRVGAGVDQACFALAVFDDGTGPALFAGGAFVNAGGAPANRIAKWDGSSWSALGSGVTQGNPQVRALAVFDDGSGAALYVGGTFSMAGGMQSQGLARWDGASWSTLGNVNGVAEVLAFAEFDDGGGPALYVGGGFTNAGGVAANRIAKWDGASWSALGDGMVDFSGIAEVRALAAFDDGSGSALYAAGRFASAGPVAASNLAKWDGASWSPVGSGTDAPIDALSVFDDGGGAGLYLGGTFTAAGGTPAQRVAAFDGATFSALAGGFNGGYIGVSALTAFDDGSGERLFACGGFQLVDGRAANRIASWDGVSWSVSGQGVSDKVGALATHDDGGGDALYAAGRFLGAGGLTTNRIARWDGASWSALGSGLNGEVRALASFGAGGAPALYAGGDFASAGGVSASYVARWDGSNWSALGSGVSGRVHAFAVFDDGSGSALYAGGAFTHAGGAVVNGVAKWDGANWSALGSGLDAGATAHALGVFDDGGGPALFVGGTFLNAGGTSAKRIAKWDGASWSALGSGMNNYVSALAVFDDGGGAELYAGGPFTNAGGVAAQRIAKWDGATWSSLGSGMNSCNALQVFDDGNGDALYAVGEFGNIGPLTVSCIAKWDGASWSALGNGLGGPAHALHTFVDARGPALYAGGQFGTCFDSGDSYIARWGCALDAAGATYCTAGTTSNACVPSIGASGSASATAGSGFTITASGVEGQRAGLLFYDLGGPRSAPWGAQSTSFLCVKAPTQRMSVLASGGNAGACNGVLSEDWNAFIAAHPSALGQPFAGGEGVCAQAWFRDPPAPKTTNLSDALIFLVAP